MRIVSTIVGVVCVCWTTIALAADWPTYLHDYDRVGATDENVAPPFTLRWVYRSPAPPRSAWSGPRSEPFEGIVMRARVEFDDALHVAIVGDRVFFGSPVDHQMRCVDAATGKTHWRFFTEGPIRLAPSIVDGKVYFGSDDGCVYCLAADDGKLNWKLRVAPHDERLLARGEMASRWPVRTGVLVDKGVAYFGAGIFPHETVYLAAADALTGKLLWRNDSISQQDAGRNDLSPQGYLLCNDDLLFVPSGRTLPVAIRRDNGQYAFDRDFGWRNTAGGEVGGAKALLADGQLFASGSHHFLALDQKTGAAGHSWVIGRQMAIAGDRAFIANGSQILGVDRAKHEAASVEKQKLYLQRQKVRRDKTKLAALEAKMAEVARGGVLWSYDSPCEDALVSAGNVVLAGGENQVLALDAETGKLLWEQKVEGRARGIAVANGSIVVSTDQGLVYRFSDAADKSPASEPARFPASRDSQPIAKDELSEMYAKAAGEIVARTGVKQGFCLVVGSERGRLIHELARRTDLDIWAVEPDAEKVAAARDALDRAGLYGARVRILQADPARMPLPNYFANLVVSDTLLLTGKLPCETADLGRHVKPLGGVVCLGAPDGSPAAKTGLKADDSVEQLKRTYARDEAQIASEGRWATLVRGKLPGAGEWSHQYGNVANTAMADDQRLKGGLGVLWYGDPGPSMMVNRHDAAAAPLSTGGRMYIQGTDKIVCHDAYNGRFLWEYADPGALRTGVFNNNETSNLAATDDYLFVAERDTCTMLDAATGKVLARFQVPDSPDGIPRQWGYIAWHNGLLYGTSTIHTDLAESLRRRGRVVASDTDAVFAFDPKSEKPAWIHRGQNIMHVTIAIGDGRLYFVDSSISQQEREQMLAEDKTELAKLTGEAAEKAAAALKQRDLRKAIALDAKTGRQLWERPIDVTNTTKVSSGGGNLSLMFHAGRLVVTGANANGHYWRQFLKGDFSRRRILVLDAATGQKLWAKDANYMNRPLVIGGEIYAEPWAFDLETGKEKTRRNPLTGEETVWRFSRPGHHCGVITATPNMMFFRSGFIGYYDLYDDSGTRHFAGQRLGCWINAIPGNGLLMIPEASAGCVCLFSIASTVVLEPREDRESWGIYSATGAATPVRHMAINLGAPGDRRAPGGTIWFGYPRPKTVGRLEFVFKLKTDFEKEGDWYDRNAENLEIAGSDIPWVYASGARGLKRLEIPLVGKDDRPGRYTVKLYFADLDKSDLTGGDANAKSTAQPEPGGRAFDVRLQGKSVAENLDVAELAGGEHKPLVRQFTGINVDGSLLIQLVPRHENPTGDQLPTLSGVEVIREDAE